MRIVLADNRQERGEQLRRILLAEGLVCGAGDLVGFEGLPGRLTAAATIDPPGPLGSVGAVVQVAVVHVARVGHGQRKTVKSSMSPAVILSPISIASRRWRAVRSSPRRLFFDRGGPGYAVCSEMSISKGVPR